MALIEGTNVRSMANWPTSVANDMLADHIASAAREFEGWVGAARYAEIEAMVDSDKTKKAAKEVETCLAIYYAAPVLHQFVMAGAPVVPKQVEDAEFQFLDMEDASAFADTFYKRAEDRFSAFDWTDEGEEETGEMRCPFHAI